MYQPRFIVPLSLATLLACQGEPIADPSETGSSSSGDTGTTTSTTGAPSGWRR